MKLFITLISSLLMGLATPAWANMDRDGAAAAAQRASGGRVLAVDKAERDGRAIWRVKVVTPQGEVRVILIDAASGRAM